MDGVVHRLGVQLLPLPVRIVDDLEGAFLAAVRERVDALWVISGRTTVEAMGLVAELALLHRLPSICESRRMVAFGGLMFYGPNPVEQYRRVASYVDRILKGAKPGDLPVEQPMTFDFVVNLKTAQALGITFPNEIMLQVTEVIQ